jgi:uncharacterized protein (TIGR00730 family)
MVKTPLSICVFCGSSHGEDPRFADAARKLGALIGARGYALVFGGGDVGLMGEVARAARAHGARVIGVLPEFLKHLEPPSKSTEELIITTDMQVRKQHMLALSDAFVCLPGGLGTLDEIFEVLTTAQLNVHHKPIVLINTAGFYEPLLALLKHTIGAKFAQPSAQTLFRVVATPEEALDAVAASSGARAQS